MQVFSYDLNTQEEELNFALEEWRDDVKDIHFLENKAVLVLKDEFNMEAYLEMQLRETEEALTRKKYELELLKSYTHIEKEKIKGAIDQATTEIKTLEAKIEVTNKWLKKTSSKK